MLSNLRGILISVLLLLFAVTTNAQSAFEGFYSQLGAGYEYDKIGSDAYSERGTSLTQNSTTTNAGRINLSVGYSYAVSPKTLVGIGAEYYFLTPTMTATNSGCPGGCNDKMEYQLKDRISVFVTPGFALKEDSLIYGKVGYSRQSGTGTIRQIVPTDANNGYSVTGSVNGYVLGVGYKEMIKSGIYFFGEVNYYGYSGFDQNMMTPNGGQASNLYPKPSAINAILGLGYKF